MEEKILQDLAEYIYNKQSNKIVGKVCKRFEIFSKERETITIKELNLIKENVKELIHEWVRDFRDEILTGKMAIKFVVENKKGA